MSINLATAQPKFFVSSDEFRHWLEENHGHEKELWVGYYKLKVGKTSLTWPESVKVALCFGWIDGIRKNIDEISYMNRFTPRKPKSNWSEINIKNAEELIKLGLMQSAGLKAFAARKK